MRKLKTKKVKVKIKSDDEISEKLHYAVILVSFDRILGIVRSLFAINDRMLVNKTKLNSNFFENWIINRAGGFGSLITLYKSLYNFMLSLQYKGEVKQNEIISYYSNTKFKLTYHNMEVFWIKFYDDLVKGYIKDLKKEPLLVKNYTYIINMMASVRMLKDALNVISNDELLEFFTKEEIKRLKTLATKSENILLSTIIEFSGLNAQGKEVIYFKYKEKFKNLALDMKKNIRREN